MTKWAAVRLAEKKFTKTDVAKYENIWAQSPHVVAKGAEKNFIDWTLARNRAGGKLPDQSDFEALCAKAILFKKADSIIGSLNQGGYKANVVAYTLSWLSRATNGRIDLRKIWQKQVVGEALQIAIKTVAPEAYKHLLEHAAGRNVTEVAKKEDCWMEFRDMKIDLPHLNADLEGGGTIDCSSPKSDAATTTARLSSSELAEKVQRVKLSTWRDLADWAEQASSLPPWQVITCRTLHGKLGKGTKLRQEENKMLADLLDTARTKGFQG